MSRKEFTIVEGNGQEVKLAVRRPQYEDYEESDKVYAIKVASLVKESVGRKKLLLRQDLAKFLKESGIWTDTDEKELQKISKEIEDMLAKLRKGGLKLSEGRQIAIDVMEKRKEAVRINAKRQAFDETTVESMAENEKIDYLVYCSTVYSDDGKNYWDSFEDMKNDKLSDAYKQASVLTVEILYNVNSDFDKNLPENRWLKKYGFVDENLNYVDRKTGEKVDRNGTPVKELQEKLVKQIENMQGEIKEEAPFVDDETGEPIVVEDKEELAEEKETVST